MVYGQGWKIHKFHLKFSLFGQLFAIFCLNESKFDFAFAFLTFKSDIFMLKIEKPTFRNLQIAKKDDKNCKCFLQANFPLIWS